MKKLSGKASIVWFVMLCFLLTVMLCGCSDDDDYEGSSTGGKKLEVSFQNTTLSVLQGFSKVVKQAADEEIPVVESMRMELLNEKGELALNDKGRPIRIDGSFERWKALYVVHYSKDKVIDKDMNSGLYEIAGYNILPPPEDGNGGLEDLVINGKTCSEITEADLKKSALDISKVQFINNANTYVELYINGEKVKPDNSFYDNSPDEQKVRDTLKLRRDLPGRMTAFLPGYLNMKITVDFDEKIEEWLDTKDMKNTLFLVQKIYDAYQNKEESICVIYYSMREGECYDVTIRVANK